MKKIDFFFKKKETTKNKTEVSLFQFFPTTRDKLFSLLIIFLSSFCWSGPKSIILQ